MRVGTSNELVAGVDEAGRGPLAGPVVAAAVILAKSRPIRGLKDSKKLTPERREVLAARIRERAVAWAIAEASHEEIDLLNILQASLLAMRRALERLATPPIRIIIDGNCVPQLPDCLGGCEMRAIIGGDDLVSCVSAASILAKTHRDALMVCEDERFPGYGLKTHFGYGTRAHLTALVQLGPSAIHRRSFNPVRSWLSGELPMGILPVE